MERVRRFVVQPFHEIQTLLPLLSSIAWLADRAPQTMLAQIMLATLSFAGLASGTILACLADRFQQSSARIELIAGVLLVIGLACIGVGLSLYIH